MIGTGDLQAHALSFCSDHDIVVHWVKRPAQSFALNEAEEIHIAPIKSAISYATALHEIGHILGRYQRSKHVLVRERWLGYGHVRTLDAGRLQWNDAPSDRSRGTDVGSWN